MVVWFMDLFLMGIMQWVLLEAFVLGVVCGLFGVWIFLYYCVYVVELFSYAMLLGFVVAVLVGALLLFGVVGGVLAVVVGIALVARDCWVGGDIGVVVVVFGFFGLGGMLVLLFDTLLWLGEILFGDLLGISIGNFVVAVALVFVVLVVLAVCYCSLVVMGFDRGFVHALVVNAMRVDFGLLVLLVLTTVVAVQGFGNLLLIALILVFVIVVFVLMKRFLVVLLIAAVLVALAGFVGLIVFYWLEIVVGALVVLCVVVLLGFVLLCGVS